MKLNFIKVSLLAAGIVVCGQLFGQTTDSSKVSGTYVKPFSGSSAFRTWSIGLNAGIMTTSTAFTANSRLGFTSPNSELGYSAYVKYQILPSFGLQADFMGGKLNGAHA